MTDQESSDRQRSLLEVRAAREQAEVLRDMLAAEYQRLCEEERLLPAALREDAERVRGMQSVRTAIKAATRALECLDQALRDMGRVREEGGG